MNKFKAAKPVFDKLTQTDMNVVGWELLEWDDNEEIVFVVDARDQSHGLTRLPHEVEFYR